MKNDEERLLSSLSLDELIKQKMEEEMQAEFKASQKIVKQQLVTEISKVPVHLVFSAQAVFKVFNRLTKQESFINGIQAEGLVGMQANLRDKIKNGQQDTFASADLYVKFEKILM